jgi:lipid-A-disaccharide synthase
MEHASPLPAVLFTAFEPSGDDHASAVIRELKRRRPDLPIYAWGGPKMRRAGAEIIAETGHDAVVGFPGLDKILHHLRVNRDIGRWIKAHPEVRLHVPVDSPAANLPICAISRRAGLKVVHLVAPQLWAWGSWRLKKLKRRTNLVLCLLPFEEAWFSARKVPARFIGHPLFDEALDLDTLAERARGLDRGSPNIAVLPGSRPAELRRNFPVLLAAFRELKRRHPEARGLVAATTEAVRESLYHRANRLGGWPDGLDVRVGETDLVVRWCDLALAVSGTVTLQIARQTKPMVIIYKVNKLTYNTVGRAVINTPYLTLPNLIANQEVVPELVPYFKGHHRVVDIADDILRSPDRMEAQRLNLRAIVSKFAGKMASADAASAIEEMLGLVATTTPANMVTSGSRG